MLILTESGSKSADRDDSAIALLVLVLKPAGAIFVAWVFAQSVPEEQDCAAQRHQQIQGVRRREPKAATRSMNLFGPRKLYCVEFMKQTLRIMCNVLSYRPSLTFILGPARVLIAAHR